VNRGGVVNLRTGLPFDVYIGRPSIWANPFSHRPSSYPGVIRVATRMEAIERHAEWIMTQHHLLDRLPELCGKVLGCWCSPLKCHGHTLVRLANPSETSDLSALMNALLDLEHG
jgi:hypothetical protein